MDGPDERQGQERGLQCGLSSQIHTGAESTSPICWLCDVTLHHSLDSMFLIIKGNNYA